MFVVVVVVVVVVTIVVVAVIFVFVVVVVVVVCFITFACQFDRRSATFLKMLEDASLPRQACSGAPLHPSKTIRQFALNQARIGRSVSSWNGPNSANQSPAISTSRSGILR